MPNPKAFNPLNKPEQMISLIAEITGESTEAVAARLERERRHPGCNVADDFARAGGPRYRWGPHLEAFYSATNAFIYELAVWNRNALKRRLRRWVSRHLGMQGKPLDVLSVGDGLGFDCLHFDARKHRMTYFELPGVTERFARRLFELSRREIPVLTDPETIPKESFDAITCFDVLEHVPDPLVIVKSLTSYLRPGGLLYVSAPFFMILPWYPTHLRANRKFAGSPALYEQAGLKLVGGQFTWYPIVLQKPPVTIAASFFSTAIVRLTGLVQKIGRISAWPFYPVHLLRRVCNQGKENHESP
jgi:SAM-dependent methyltransferase